LSLELAAFGLEISNFLREHGVLPLGLGDSRPGRVGAILNVSALGEVALGLGKCVLFRGKLALRSGRLLLGLGGLLLGLGQFVLEPVAFALGLGVAFVLEGFHSIRGLVELLLGCVEFLREGFNLLLGLGGFLRGRFEFVLERGVFAL
jgi:hypothetical protein